MSFERDIEDLEEDLAKARAAYNSSLNAGQRVADPETWKQALKRKLWRVMELEKERNRLREIMEDDGA